MKIIFYFLPRIKRHNVKLIKNKIDESSCCSQKQLEAQIVLIIMPNIEKQTVIKLLASTSNMNIKCIHLTQLKTLMFPFFPFQEARWHVIRMSSAIGWDGSYLIYFIIFIIDFSKFITRVITFLRTDNTYKIILITFKKFTYHSITCVYLLP